MYQHCALSSYALTCALLKCGKKGTQRRRLGRAAAAAMQGVRANFEDATIIYHTIPYCYTLYYDIICSMIYYINIMA